MPILVKKALDFIGLKSWHVVVLVVGSLMLAWLAFDNAMLANKVKAKQNELVAASERLDRAIELNKELNNTIVMLQIGKVIDEEIVRDNQLEIDNMRKENDERKAEVARQKSSGPAPNIVICAITRVCDE